MSETEKNLLKAFAGESMARNKYTFFADQAKKEGFRQIYNLFLETADNERGHAERLFEFIKGDVKTDLNAGILPLGKTADNLKAAAEGEHYEWDEMYPGFQKIAEEEGKTKIAKVFKEIGEVEELHEARYLKLLDNLKKGLVFKRETEVEWHCLNCGYVHKGKEAPTVCPACGHPQSFYELRAVNW